MLPRSTPRWKPAVLQSVVERLLTLALVLIPAGACAHGAWPPRFGGVMNDGGETSFELVRDPSGIVAHVSDHGKPLDVTGSAPELQIQRDGHKIIFKGKPRGSAIFFVGAKLMVRDEVVLRLASVTGEIALGRFPTSAVEKLALQASKK
jgi:hypothetical protein